MDWLDLGDEYDRLRREQRKLSRKEHGSNNYENQRQTVAKVNRHIRQRVLDYQHKLTTWLVTEYDAVFVEDLNVAGMLQSDGNARNKQDAAWRQFITLLEYKVSCTGHTSYKSTQRERQKSVRRVVWKQQNPSGYETTRVPVVDLSVTVTRTR